MGASMLSAAASHADILQFCSLARIIHKISVPALTHNLENHACPGFELHLRIWAFSLIRPRACAPLRHLMVLPRCSTSRARMPQIISEARFLRGLYKVRPFIQTHRERTLLIAGICCRQCAGVMVAGHVVKALTI